MDMNKKTLVVPLAFSYDALEPYISEQTMYFHHDKHYQTYADNLQKTLAPYPQYASWSVEELLLKSFYLPWEIQTAVKNNAGGVYNHTLFFSLLTPPAQSIAPTGAFGKAIDEAFGSLENLLAQMKKNALAQFGSGWAWLCMEPTGQLKLMNTANQDTVITLGLAPILLVDVWEHAYYLDYQNRRAEYLDSWQHVINWKQAEENYIAAKRG